MFLVISKIEIKMLFRLLLLCTITFLYSCSSGSSDDSINEVILPPAPPPPDPDPPPVGDIPPLGGVFALTNGGGESAKIDDEVMTISQSDYIHGVTLRSSWSVLEPEQGVMDFSSLDNRVQMVIQSGKKVKLILLGGALTPDWVYDELGVEFIEFEDRNTGGTGRNPAFWEDNYLAVYENYIAQIFEHYNAIPEVVGITIAGPSVKTAEMNFFEQWPRCQNIVTPEDNICVNEDRWIFAWKKSVDLFTQYSQTNFGIAINTTIYGESASDEIIEYAINIDNGQNKFFIQWNGFKETSSDLSDYSYNRIATVFKSKIITGFQWIWNVSCQETNDCRFDAGNLLSGYQKAKTEAQVDFVEIYQQDILNPNLLDEVIAGFDLFNLP